MIIRFESYRTNDNSVAITNVAKIMKRLLPRKISRIIKLLSKIADKGGFKLYLVGGCVRDLLLGVKNLDLDVVIEGDAVKFSKCLDEVIPGKLTLHKRFGTATLAVSDKIKIDIATARREFYKHPAALPSVHFSSVREDLRRRDFTINTLAVSINKRNFGNLLDYFDGWQDLKNGIIRVLHDRSFSDDPTRILRAVRFEQRFNFKIDKHTRNLIKEAARKKIFIQVSKHRIRDEMIAILQEKSPLKNIKRLNQLYGLEFIHPRLKFNKIIQSDFTDISKTIDWFYKNYPQKRKLNTWILYFMVLTAALNKKETVDLCQKLGLKKGETIIITSFKQKYVYASNTLTADKINPSKVYKILRPLSYETLLMIMAKCGTVKVKKRIQKFVKVYNEIRVGISGDDLKKMGVKPGPQYKILFKKLLYKIIDGEINSKQQQIKYIQKLVKI